ncbi:MAG: hypothetical protein IK084_03960 [Bacteroidaceae bacterium]|nr:hypothetical protein [Bacteroidaceae bacterium]
MSRYTCTLLISLLCLSLTAKEKQEPIPKAPVFCGVAVFADLTGPVMKAIGCRYDQLEIGARLNFRDHFFPICELGIGESDREGEQYSNKFHTRAPYFRVGMDYNFNKKHNGNRLMGGLRYGFSSYKFDYSNPDFADDIWGGQTGLELKDLQARAQWLEFLVGCETKLWSFIRLGWNIRFKARLHQKTSTYGQAYYTPGYGKNNSTTFGGTMNIIFDIGKTSKKLNGK